MTGYDSDYAIWKQPIFLQDPNTSQIVRDKIRKKLINGDNCVKFSQIKLAMKKLYSIIIFDSISIHLCDIFLIHRITELVWLRIYRSVIYIRVELLLLVQAEQIEN
jgi:hypothetical protein